MRLLFLYLLASATAVAQPLTETQKLASLGQIWGFLKYYHPTVASGQHDWDAQLVRLIPRVQQAQGRTQLSAVYQQLLDSLGVVPHCKRCVAEGKLSVSQKRNLDLSFLRDSTVLTKALQAQLTYLAENRYVGRQHYVSTAEGTGNTSYENEKSYADMTLPDESHRLLALFRYWNIIHYFFPYKYAIDGDWKTALTDLIPVFREATTEQAYQNAIYRMVARIQDSHGFVSAKSMRCLRCDLGTYWLPFDLKLMNNEAVITRFYNDSARRAPLLTVGTVITAVDGESVSNRIARNRPFVSASNEAALLRDARYFVGIGPTDHATITIQHQGRDTALVVRRYPYLDLGKAIRTEANAALPMSQWLADSVAYVNLGQLKGRHPDSMMRPLMRARAIIFDLRNYPQGIFWMVGRYLATNSAVFATFTGPDLQYPGTFKSVGSTRIPRVRRDTYRGKAIVLVDEYTQSQAEFTAMAFRAVPGVVLVGSPTAGADGNISTIPLPGGYQTAFSGIGVYYPDGRETQRVGIVPDVLVRPTAEGIRAGRDEVLDKALDVARQDAARQ